MASIIANHNKKILSSGKPGPINDGGCNCRNPPCPMNGNCLENCVVYKAEVCTDDTSKTYIGSTEPQFKDRWRNHKTSFEKRTKGNNKNNKKVQFHYPTRLARYVWGIKDAGKTPTISWSRMKRAAGYACGGLRCNLCLEEKLSILQATPLSLINKRSELLYKCPHKRKHKLISLKSAVT